MWEALTLYFVPLFQDNAAGLGVQGSTVNVGSSSSLGRYTVTAATSAAMDVDVVLSRPFAVIDEITEASPAAEDGLQLGDQVVKFGNVQSGENLLRQLAAEAQSNQGCAVSMTVIRQGAMTNVQVTPRVWQGRGLLGYVHLSSFLVDSQNNPFLPFFFSFLHTRIILTCNPFTSADAIFGSYDEFVNGTSQRVDTKTDSFGSNGIAF